MSDEGLKIGIDNAEQDPLKVSPGGLIRAGIKVTGGILKVATLPVKLVGMVADELFEDDGRITKKDGGFRSEDWGKHR